MPIIARSIVRENISVIRRYFLILNIITEYEIFSKKWRNRIKLHLIILSLFQDIKKQ